MQCVQLTRMILKLLNGIILELDAFNISRRVIQLKGLYSNNSGLVPTESTYAVIGLYLLHLLASGRIGKCCILSMHDVY